MDRHGRPHVAGLYWYAQYYANCASASLYSVSVILHNMRTLLPGEYFKTAFYHLILMQIRQCIWYHVPAPPSYTKILYHLCNHGNNVYLGFACRDIHLFHTHTVHSDLEYT